MASGEEDDKLLALDDILTVAEEATAPTEVETVHWENLPSHDLTNLGTAVHALCLSPNGQLLAIGGEDTAVQIWSLAERKELRRLEGHGASVVAMAFSHDGMWLVTGSRDKTAMLWHCTSGCVDKVLSGHDGEIRAVAIAGSDRFVLTGSSDQSARIWVADSGAEWSRLLGHDAGVAAVCWAPDEKSVVTAGDDLFIRLWDVKNGEEKLKIAGHSCLISALLFSSLETFVSASYDGTMRVWERSTGREAQRMIISDTHCEVKDLRLISRGAHLLSASWDGTIRIWDRATGKELQRLQEAQVNAVCCSHDGQLVISGSESGRVKIRNLAVHEEAFQCRAGIEKNVRVICFSQSGVYLALGCASGVIHIMSTKQQKVVKRFGEEISGLSALSFSPHEDAVAAGYSDKTVRIWEWGTGVVLWLLEGHNGAVSGVHWSRSNDFIATSSADRTCRIWDVATRTLRHVLQGHDQEVICSCLSMDCAWLVSAGSDRTVRIWDMAQGTETLQLCTDDDVIAALAVSNHCRFLAAGGKKGGITVWEIGSGKGVQRITLLEGCTSLDFSRNDQHLITCSKKGVVRIADIATGEFVWSQAYQWSTIAATSPHSVLAAFEPRGVVHVVENVVLEDFSVLGYDSMCGPKDVKKAFFDCVALATRTIGYDWRPFQLGFQRWKHSLLFNGCTFSSSKQANVLQLAAELNMASFLTLALSYAPFAVVFQIDNERMAKGNGLLSCALEHRHAASVIAILDVIAELLTVPTTGNLHERRFTSVRRHRDLMPFQGDCLESHLQQQQHIGDLVDVNELCAVGGQYPTLFVDFVKKLRLVPAYSSVLGDLQTATTKSMLLATGSSQRVPIGFWSQQKLTSPHGRGGVEISAWLVALQGICQRHSKFLRTVVRAADRTKTISVFDNEVVRMVVYFKWHAVAHDGFYFDLLGFSGWSLIFQLNALTFEYYSKSNNRAIVGLGILLWCAVSLCTTLFTIQEGQQMLLRWKVYFHDWWNAINALLILFAATSLIYQMVIMSYQLRSSSAPKAIEKDYDNLAIIEATVLPFLIGKLLYFLQGIESNGKFVRMTLKIMKRIEGFSVMLFLFISTFAGSFTLLLQRVDPHDVDGFYHRYDYTLMTVYGFLLGNFSLRDMKQARCPALAFLLLAVFMYLIVIVLLNLLIAMMGDIYSEVQAHALAEEVYGWARLVLEYETRVNGSASLHSHAFMVLRALGISTAVDFDDAYPPWLQILRPGSKEQHLLSTEGATDSSICVEKMQTMVQTMTGFNASVQEKLVGLERSMSNMDDHLRGKIFRKQEQLQLQCQEMRQEMNALREEMQQMEQRIIQSLQTALMRSSS